MAQIDRREPAQVGVEEVYVQPAPLGELVVNVEALESVAQRLAMAKMVPRLQLDRVVWLILERHLNELLVLLLVAGLRALDPAFGKAFHLFSMSNDPFKV